MASVIMTNVFRAAMARQIADRAAYVVFGDGGYVDSGVVAADADQTELNNMLLKKTATTVVNADYSVTVTGMVEKHELVGETISEAGALDSAGILMALKNFAGKIKEDDESYEVNITITL